MSSDDRGPLVFTPDMFPGHVQVVDVSKLEQWDGPYDGDVGAAHQLLGTFGQLTLPIVVDGVVVLGQELVAAEVTGPQFDGTIAVLDLSDLGWSATKIKAAALGAQQLPRRASIDQEELLDLLAAINDENPAYLAGAGYDLDDLEVLRRIVEGDQAPLDVDDVEAPEGFASFDETDVDTDHECPKCGYVWSGKG